MISLLSSKSPFFSSSTLFFMAGYQQPFSEELIAMWVRRSALRPVPTYARVSTATLERIEDLLADDEPSSQERLADAFVRFESTQSALASRIADGLRSPLEETALALGYFLSLAVWLAFEHTFEERLHEISEQDLEATEQSLNFDEELRREAPDESLDTDDVVAMEQPDVVDFVREHIDVALEAHAVHVDIKDVDTIYRLVLLEIVALSYAVQAPHHFPLSKAEWTALFYQRILSTVPKRAVR
jgi:hypothetical protein